MAGADRDLGGTAAQQNTAVLLATAADRLEDALERVDLENDRELADQIIEAIETTDEAVERATLERDRPGEMSSRPR